MSRLLIKKCSVLVATAAVMSFAALSGSFLYAQTGGNQTEIDELNRQIAEKKEKAKQLEASIEEYKKKISQTQTQAASLKNQTAILDNRVAQTTLDIEATRDTLEALGLEIETLQLGIADKEKVIAKQRAMIAELVRNIREQDGQSYVEIMSQYDSFSDFYNRVRYLEKIDQDLGKSVHALRSAREDLAHKKAQAVDRQESYQALKQQLDQKKDDLSEQLFAKKDLLLKTKSSEATYNTLLASLRQQYQKSEQEIENTEQLVRKKLSNQVLGQSASGQFAWPVAGRYITAYFRDPEYPFRTVFEHSAIDIRAPQGSVVRAAGGGYIARAKRCASSSCYSYVMIVHADGISTVYGHLSQIVAKEDQYVVQGDIIGYSGGTPGTVGAGPFVTGPHLHFEVRKDGIPVDPLAYLPKS